MSHSPYAAAFAEPAGSPIRELFPYLSRPGMISFAGGYPSPTLLDGAGIEQAAQRVFAQGAGILQYGATEGARRCARRWRGSAARAVSRRSPRTSW